ncbi:MAG: aspartate kinase [Bacteroidales bacterium]|nr:aspartate kinase [Bacteroidales bacterium]
MLVYKFGGASVKDAPHIRSLVPLILEKKSSGLTLVISAMGKMTNAFEKLLAFSRAQNSDYQQQFDFIKNYHLQICQDLFLSNHPIYNTLNQCFENIDKALFSTKNDSYDFAYDQVVSYGEILSTKMISAFLSEEKIENQWVDASMFIFTNKKYRDARVDWPATYNAMNSLMLSSKPNTLIISQGFIGGDGNGNRTTLGREGSDFSAAIFANAIQAESVTVWKDVPGVLNADPHYFPSAIQLNHLSYHETVELAFYGAQVIHPRTLYPLKQKQIPLYVRSFIEQESYSTIDGDLSSDKKFTSFIIKENQILFSISTRDFSFIDAERLAEISRLFSIHHFHIRLLQNSALNISIVADENPLQLEELFAQLHQEYTVKYNRDLSLFTIRHWKDDRVADLFQETKILLEMHSRLTRQFVMKTSDLMAKIDSVSNYLV